MEQTTQGTVLIVSHVIPFPPAAGNELRILKMISWLRGQGFRIVLLLNHSPLTPEAKKSLESVVDGVHFIADDYGPPFPSLAPQRAPFLILKEKLALALPDSWLYRGLFGMEKQKKIQSDGIKRSLAYDRLIQVTRHLTEFYRPVAVLAQYIFAAPCLDAVPAGILKIIDTHDMFSRKKEQVISFGIDDLLSCSPSEERKYLLKSDLVIAIQSNEARMFRNLVMERDIITIGIDFDVVAKVDNSAVVPGTILVIGSDNSLNRHGLLEFYTHAWPAIRLGHPGATLRIIGKLGNHLPTEDDRVQKVGWVENLDEEYRKASVMINPTLAGTGLKIKSVEALCQAKPLVGTPNSVEGIDYTGESPFIVCRDWRQFADETLALLQSEEKRLRLQLVAWQFARDTFNTSKIYAPLENKLRAILHVHDEHRSN